MSKTANAREHMTAQEVLEAEHIEKRAASWRDAIGRGDASREHAATYLTGSITYPYATPERWAAVMKLVKKALR